MNNTSVIGLGSNINPQANIAKAKELIQNEFDVLGESQFVQTAPIGYKNQDDFINGAILIRTNLNMEQLTGKLKALEDQLGRQRSTIKFGPRTIDLDIVVFNDKIVDKDFYDREFLKNSVLELIPTLDY